MPGCARCWMKTRSCGWTTSWASNPSSSWSTCGSPITRSPSCGTAHSISEIHITMAEDFGVEDRGKFYDAVGALRDVVQNHLLQVLALVAMEPPVGPSADDLNDKKAEVFRAMPALDPKRCVRGQYRGYTDVAGVAKDSQDRDLRRSADRDRQLALGRSADLPARRKGVAGEGHRGPALSPPRPRVSLPAQPPTGRAQPDRAAHRPRSGHAHAVVRPSRRLVARRSPRLLVRRRPRRTGAAVRAASLRRVDRRSPALRPGRQHRTDVANRAAAAGQAGRHPPLRPRVLGARGRAVVAAWPPQLARAVDASKHAHAGQ